VKRKVKILDAVQQLHQQADIVFQPYAFADLDQMIPADAAEVRIVTQQIGEFSPLLHQPRFSEPGDPLGKALDAEHLGQH
jgi:hypothetical protein